jgi:hypothetical protein
VGHRVSNKSGPPFYTYSSIARGCHEICHQFNRTTKKISRTIDREVPVSPNQSLFAIPTVASNYKPNYECVWYICSSKGTRYYLEVIQLDLEYSLNCHKDWFEIKTGGREGKLKGKLCGYLIGERQYTVNHHCLWLRFRSDGGVQGKGIKGWFVSSTSLKQSTSPKHFPDGLFCEINRKIDKLTNGLTLYYACTHRVYTFNNCLLYLL